MRHALKCCEYVSEDQPVNFDFRPFRAILKHDSSKHRTNIRISANILRICKNYQTVAGPVLGPRLGAGSGAPGICCTYIAHLCVHSYIFLYTCALLCSSGKKAPEGKEESWVYYQTST